MKIRLGFVSNSSSSCFFLMATLEKHNEVLLEMEKFEQKIVEEIVDHFTFDGKECVKFVEHRNDEGSEFKDYYTKVKIPADYLEENEFADLWLLEGCEVADEEYARIIQGIAIQSIMDKYKNLIQLQEKDTRVLTEIKDV